MSERTVSKCSDKVQSEYYYTHIVLEQWFLLQKIFDSALGFRPIVTFAVWFYITGNLMSSFISTLADFYVRLRHNDALLSCIRYFYL